MAALMESEIRASTRAQVRLEAPAQNDADATESKIGEGLATFSNLYVTLGIALLLAIVVMSIGVGFLSEQIGLALIFLSLSLIYFSAACFVGVLLGFLFGVPRQSGAPSSDSAQGDANPGGSGSSPYIRTNSNLDRISDWVTAAIVALTLSNFSELASVFSSIDDFAWNVFDDRSREVGGIASIAAQCLTVLGLTSGFIIGYVSTRVFLANLFVQLEAVIGPRRARQIAKTLDPTLDRANELLLDKGITPQFADSSAVLKLAKADTGVLKDAATLESVGKARVALGDLEGARAAFARSLEVEPGRESARLLLSSALQRLGRMTLAEGVLHDTDGSVAESVQKMFNALYRKPPHGFEKALAIADRIEDRDEARANARFWAMKACALGQRHAYEARRGAEPEALAALRAKCLESIDNALELDEEWLGPLEDELAKGGDLESFVEDEEFRRRLH